VDIYQAGLVELPDLQRRAAEIAARLQNLHAMRATLAEQRTALARDNQLRRRVHDFAGRVRSIIDHLDDVQKQHLLRLLIDEVRVTGWHVQIRLRVPLDPPEPGKPTRNTPPTPSPPSTEDGLRSIGRDDFGLVDEPVDHGVGDDVAEHLAPSNWGITLPVLLPDLKVRTSATQRERADNPSATRHQPAGGERAGLNSCSIAQSGSDHPHPIRRQRRDAQRGRSVGSAAALEPLGLSI
jgi:hypothetical protein